MWDVWDLWDEWDVRDLWDIWDVWDLWDLCLWGCRGAGLSWAVPASSSQWRSQPCLGHQVEMRRAHLEVQCTVLVALPVHLFLKILPS